MIFIRINKTIKGERNEKVSIEQIPLHWRSRRKADSLTSEGLGWVLNEKKGNNPIQTQPC